MENIKQRTAISCGSDRRLYRLFNERRMLDIYGRLERTEKKILLTTGVVKCTKCCKYCKIGADISAAAKWCKSCTSVYDRERQESLTPQQVEDRNRRQRARASKPEVKKKRAKYQRAWQQENREKVSKYNSHRRARKVGALGSFTGDQVKARFEYYGNKCIYCGSESDLQIEHRIPLARGGTNWPSNLAPACKSCNCKKHTKTDREYREALNSDAK